MLNYGFISIVVRKAVSSGIEIIQLREQDIHEHSMDLSTSMDEGCSSP